MDPAEIVAKATIAAALISRGAVEVPAIPASGEWLDDEAGLRLRELTDYVYQMLVTAKVREPN